MTEQATLTADAASTRAASDTPSRSEYWSARVFGAAVAVALPLLLWFGRDHWFFIDDWWVLTRDGPARAGYFDGHNGHWVTLLRLDYRLNFELWGLRSYLPYQVPVILAHLAAAVLVRLLTRRLGVRGWISTAAGLTFLFFGASRENMVYGFQASLTGSVVCGLALFLLGDGPRSVTRRDCLVFGIGLLGLMTSGVFPALLVGFCVTTLIRRGVWVTAFYAIPLGAIFLAWQARYGREGAPPLQLTSQAVRFVGRMLWAIFDALAQGGIGVVLVAVAGLGLGTAIGRAWRSGSWTDAALPLGLAVGWVVFATLTALARANVPITAQSYGSGRYLHVGAALLLPLVAAGAERLARQRMLVGAAALIPLAIGLPGNLDRLSHTAPIYGGNRELLLAMAHSPFIGDVPPDTLMVRGAVFDIPLTAGWMARQVAAGRVPEPDGTDPVRDLTAASSLVLAQEGDAAHQRGCPQLTGPQPLTLRSGDQLAFAGAVNVTARDGTHEGQPIGFSSRDGSVIRALAGPVDVVVRPAIGQQPRMCPPTAEE